MVDGPRRGSGSAAVRKESRGADGAGVRWVLEEGTAGGATNEEATAEEAATEEATIEEATAEGGEAVTDPNPAI